MEFIHSSTIPVLVNGGTQSRQLLFPENSASRRLTITEVTVQPGAISPVHSHDTSEQVWVALNGSGTLLLAEGKTEPFQAGDVVRFADGDPHGFHNTSHSPFTYLSVTSPPINFRAAYATDWNKP